jgi:MYXO-CTERM domain-containing protein
MSERRLLLRAMPAGLAVLFILALVPSPVSAEPGVPYVSGCSVAPVSGAPMVIDSAMCETITGRVFPEASPNSIAGSPNALPGASTSPVQDYVSYFEFQAGLDYLAGTELGQQYLNVHQVAMSVGLCPQPAPSVPLVGSGGDCPTERDHFPIYMLELTNKASPIPLENRQSMLFMLSIHGNEKGGREGGFRVLEDLVKGIGFAAEGVQNGAGLPAPIERPTGEGEVQTYHDYLDFMRVFLLFPNADGWAHDEAPYPATDPYCGTLFCRTNGNNTDLNRQGPTSGWQNPNRNVVGEPESIGYYNWMLQQDIDWAYAIDIHGMLNHQNFGAIMLPAGAMTPQEMQRSIRLAETLKDRLNQEADGHFAAWTTLFTAGETAEGAASPATGSACVPGDPTGFGECPLAGSALATAGSSQFAEYYTVIDAIGYTDSGFNGDYFAQDSGLNAPGYDIELAYNHITTDSQYMGPGSVFNDYHVKMVREIVKSFMDASALDVKISFETRGLRTLYVEPSFVATSLDDFNGDGTLRTPGGWADQNPGDDLWDYGKNGGFTARPAEYWEDLKPFVRNGDQPGVLTKTTAGALTASQLALFDQLVIPGSAIDDLETNPTTIAAIKAWVEAGGNLVLTDQALRFLDLSGVTSGAVDVLSQYMGGIRMDLTQPVFYEYQDTSSEANRNVRGGVKQTYEPTPLGFETGANAAPNWFVDAAEFAAAGGEAWGLACGTTQISDPCSDNGVGLGRVPVGEGQIQVIGSLLPDPTEEFYHPYGLDPYATTYSGNQILRNMLFWGNVLDTPPITIAGGEIIQSDNEPTAPADATDGAGDDDKDTPSLGALALLAIVALAAIVLRRRR